jgi:hypothetical protein
MAIGPGLTNQRLYQCRLLLDQSPSMEASLHNALVESSAIQLHLAYRCYLNELADAYRVQGPILSLEQLVSRAPVVTSELDVLVHLEATHDSWLGALNGYINSIGWEASVSLPGPDSPPDIGVASSLIVSDRPSQDVTSFDLVENWYRSLERLIEQQRSLRQES